MSSTQLSHPHCRRELARNNSCDAHHRISVSWTAQVPQQCRVQLARAAPAILVLKIYRKGRQEVRTMLTNLRRPSGPGADHPSPQHTRTQMTTLTIHEHTRLAAGTKAAIEAKALREVCHLPCHLPKKYLPGMVEKTFSALAHGLGAATLMTAVILHAVHPETAAAKRGVIVTWTVTVTAIETAARKRGVTTAVITPAAGKLGATATVAVPAAVPATAAAVLHHRPGTHHRGTKPDAKSKAAIVPATRAVPVPIVTVVVAKAAKVALPIEIDVSTAAEENIRRAAAAEIVRRLGLRRSEVEVHARSGLRATRQTRTRAHPHSAKTRSPRTKSPLKDACGKPSEPLRRTSGDGSLRQLAFKASWMPRARVSRPGMHTGPWLIARTGSPRSGSGCREAKGCFLLEMSPTRFGRWALHVFCSR